MFDSIKAWLERNPVAAEALSFLGVLALSLLAYYVTKRFIISAISRLIARSRTKWDDILLRDKVLHRVALIAPLIVIYNFAYLVPSAEAVVQRVVVGLVVFVVILALGAFLNAVNDIYDQFESFRGRPIKGYVQIAKLVIYILGTIAAIGLLTGNDPWVLVSGLGAMTAVLLLIFRDTILSLVASIQITSNDLMRVGDWITVPQFNADGDVVDIALHSVSVQNFDKTITVFPTHKLLDESYRNWRGMQQAGARRIMRSVYLDQSSVRFCDQEMLARFEKINLLADYVRTMTEELRRFNEEQGIDPSQPVNGRRMTNIGTFRMYLNAYLAHHPKIRTDMIILVRQLQPTAQGIPIELYAFADTTDWKEYETIQSDIFDHLLAIIPQFGLRVFQYPSGVDVEHLAGRNGRTRDSEAELPQAR